MGQGPRHSRGTGAGLGGGVAGGLCADHHRSGPAALQSAVRTVPESRARVHARFRHRLLHGPARGGDPLCPGPLRQRQGRPDHHLWRALVQGRGARRGPRLADALRSGRSPVQDDPAGRRQARQHCQGPRRRTPSARGCQGGGGGPPAGLRRKAGRAVSQRIDPRGGRGDRGPAAGPAGAAVSRPGLGYAGHAVQYEMGRGSRAGQVRLPGPQDADGDPERRGVDQRAGPSAARRGRRAGAL